MITATILDAKRIDELIDTLWNVNLIFTVKIFRHFYELIDTLWNVNAFR